MEEGEKNKTTLLIILHYNTAETNDVGHPEEQTPVSAR